MDTDLKWITGNEAVMTSLKQLGVSVEVFSLLDTEAECLLLVATEEQVESFIEHTIPTMTQAELRIFTSRVLANARLWIGTRLPADGEVAPPDA